MKNLKKYIKELNEKKLSFFLDRTLIFFFSAILSFTVFKISDFFKYENEELVYSITSPKRMHKPNYFTGCFMCKDSLNELYSDFTLFNKGNNYFDFSRILNDGTITLKTKDKIKHVEILKIVKSRDDLPITAKVDSNKIIIKFADEEAFEKLDGFNLQFKYIGTNNYVWQLKNRIKGYPNGVAKLDSRFFLSKNLLGYPIKILGLLSLMGIFLFIMSIYIYIKENYFFYLLAILGVFVFLFATYFLFKDDTFNFRRPQFIENQEVINQSKYIVDCPYEDMVRGKIKESLKESKQLICE